MNELMLIKNVRNHDCLFNSKSLHYRDQTMRQEAWEEIAHNLNSTVISVRTAWTKLRNAFTNAKKRRKNKTGQEIIKVGPWKYDRELAFLLPHLDCRKTQSNPETQEDKSSNIIHDEITADEDLFDYTPQESITVKAEILTQPQISQNIDVPVDSQIYPQPSQEQAYLSSKDASLNPALEMVRIMTENAEVRNERLNKTSSNFNSIPHLDEVDMFYLSMAKTVKRLPPADQAYIRMEFCQMVSQAEIRNLETRNHLTSFVNTTQSDTDNQSTSSSTSLHPTPL